MKKILLYLLILVISFFGAGMASASENDYGIKDISATENQIALQDAQNAELLNEIKSFSYYENGKRVSLNSENITPEFVERFVDYKIEASGKTVTPTERRALSKNAYRVIFAEAADLAAPYIPIASYCLRHSLSDNPANLSYFTGSYTSNQVYATSALRNFINQTHSAISSTSSSSYWGTGSANLGNSGNMDLRLAFGRVSFSANAFKSGIQWQIVYTVSDVYNFEYWDVDAVDDSLSGVIVNINNLAAAAQAAGAITPYNVYIYYQETV